MLLASILTILSPVCAYGGFTLFFITRVVIGILHGVVFPVMQVTSILFLALMNSLKSKIQDAWTHWAPPVERSRLVAFHVSGASFGTIIIFPLGGLLADNFGWESIFYVTGACRYRHRLKFQPVMQASDFGCTFSLFWCFLWFFLVFDSPAEHPRISDSERFYIEESIREYQCKTTVPKSVPWRSLFTSGPVIGLIAGHVASNWGLYQLNTLMPTYLATVLRYFTYHRTGWHNNQRVSRE